MEIEIICSFYFNIMKELFLTSDFLLLDTCDDENFEIFINFVDFVWFYMFLNDGRPLRRWIIGFIFQCRNFLIEYVNREII